MPDRPLVVQPQDARFNVLIPCPPEEFAEFMAKLLGKPQVAAGEFTGPFDIELRDIENFYYLIQHRNIEQNRGNLLQFTSTIYYDDGTSVDVETLERLKTYAEVRPLISTGVTLTWVYLVAFPNSSVPERQQIEVTIETRQWRGTAYAFRDRVVREFARYPSDPFPRPNSDRISYRISYTARTWGTDIENLLKDHIKSLIIPEPSRSRAFLRKLRNYVANVIALSIFAIFLRAGIWFADWMSLKTRAKYATIVDLHQSQIEQINSKLDNLYTIISGASLVSTMTVALIYVVLTLIVSYAIAFSISEDIADPRPAFLRLTRNAEQAKEVALAEYESSWKKFFGTFVVASVAGVAGNILTWFIWG